MCSAPQIWCTLFGLVIWIAIHVCLCEDVMHYMDDAWLYDTNPVLTYYAPYDAFCAAKQVTLLQLYNELGLPHVKLKQVYGWALEIISLYMDPFIMTISMSEELQDKLTAAIC